MKDKYLPSGDQRGAKSGPGFFVICFKISPSFEINHISEFAFLFSN